MIERSQRREYIKQELRWTRLKKGLLAILIAIAFKSKMRLEKKKFASKEKKLKINPSDDGVKRCVKSQELYKKNKLTGLRNKKQSRLKAY